MREPEKGRLVLGLDETMVSCRFFTKNIPQKLYFQFFAVNRLSKCQISFVAFTIPEKSDIYGSLEGLKLEKIIKR